MPSLHDAGPGEAGADSDDYEYDYDGEHSNVLSSRFHFGRPSLLFAQMKREIKIKVSRLNGIRGPALEGRKFEYTCSLKTISECADNNNETKPSDYSWAISTFPAQVGHYTLAAHLNKQDSNDQIIVKEFQSEQAVAAAVPNRFSSRYQASFSSSSEH